MFMGKGHPMGGNKNKMPLFCDLKISTLNKLNKNLYKLLRGTK